MYQRIIKWYLKVQAPCHTNQMTRCPYFTDYSAVYLTINILIS